MQRSHLKPTYTFTGSLELLAVNPYEQFDALYSLEAMERHAATEDGEEPHAFAVAERIFRAITEVDASPQSVVVSGESGAGKTETNKHLVAYLRWRSGAAQGGAAGLEDGATIPADKISQAISLSNIVLEALGHSQLQLVAFWQVS
eukprot:4173642-Prymnesium_polylepis.2